MHALVTGGAGFIGSHLAEALLEKGNTVTVLDDLSSGRKGNLSAFASSSDFQFVLGDCRSPMKVRKALKNADAVFHFAANSEVRQESSSPRQTYEHNIKATFVLLEEMRRHKVDTIVFASSSTVYGDAKQIPTPVTYGPLKPISFYGASKLGCEAMVSSYCNIFRKKGIILRFANIIGARSSHGIIPDFYRKLKNDSSTLQVLGDGRQSKSYLYVDDCVSAILKAFESSDEMMAIFNIGSEDKINVTEIAKIVLHELGLKDTKLIYSGGVDGGRGWAGDVKTMLLDLKEIKALGWTPKFNSKSAIEETVHELNTS